MSLDFVKNKYTLILLLIAILLAGGVFYWQSQKPTPPDKWDTAETSSYKNFKVQKDSNEKIVVNEKMGFKFILPSEWKRVKKVNYTSFLSPEAKRSTSSKSILKEGCRISLKISDIETNIKKLKTKQKNKFNWSSLTLNNFDQINLNGRKALEHTFQDKEMKMYFIGIHFPTKNKLYEVVLDAAINNKKKCKKEFNNILDTVSIQ